MKINYKGFMRERIRKNPVTINSSASFFDVQKLIQEKGVRHLPVVDEANRLVGIVTESDIRKAGPSDVDMLRVQEAASLLRNLKVSAFMTPKEKLITITPDTIIEEAVQLMHDNKIGCLPVLEGGKLYGIFTETDALDHLADVFGSKEKGTRLTVALEDKPGMMLGVFEIFKKHNVNVTSMVSPSFMVEGMRIAAIRIRTEEYEPIVRDLEKAGYKVLSVGKWSSAEYTIPPIKKILYATDHSKNSAYAFLHTVDIARNRDAKIVILHVIEFGPDGIHLGALRVGHEHEQSEMERIDVEQTKNHLQKVCQKAESEIGSPCVELVSNVIVRVGYPAEEILNVTDEEGCDLIILGTHGKGFLKRSFLGSVSNAVVNRAQKPVLLIPLPSEKITINWDEI